MIDAIPYRRRSAAIFSACVAAFLLLALSSLPAHAFSAACAKITIQGEVSYGKEWSAPIGQGGVLRLVPIQPSDKYSGWDIVLDRIEPAGFPDAVFLATPPFGSLNEREIGITFSLRAQDAIGWNPRTFGFLTDPATFHAAQQLYLSSHGAADPKSSARLLDIIQSASQGEIRILDSHLAPGIADPASYAQNWALASFHTPHQVVPPPSGQPTPRGVLLWMRFSLTLWPPPG